MAARLVFDLPKRTHVTPLLVTLHWLPVAARIRFKPLTLAYRTATGSAPAYLNYMRNYNYNYYDCIISLVKYEPGLKELVHFNDWLTD